jgi:hypothetical protein
VRLVQDEDQRAVALAALVVLRVLVPVVTQAVVAALVLVLVTVA